MCYNCAFCKIADRFNISVCDFRMTNKKAFAFCDAIVVDFKRIETRRECKKIIAEELGHCIYKAYYQLSDYDTNRRMIGKAERKAAQYAYKLLVPISKLKKLIKKCDNDYEIADMLDVDIDTLREAVEYYRIKNLLE